MNLDKESILFYVVLIIFVVTAIVTILGIIQKVSIEKKYLNGLFASLILELVAAVIFMFANMDISAQAAIQNSHIDESVQQVSQLKSETAAVDKFILTLPADIRGTVDEVHSNLQKKYLELSDANKGLGKAQEKIVTLQQQLSEKKGFLNKVSELENTRIKLENTINLKHETDKKIDVYLLIQKILQRIGYYQGPLDGDPLKTQDSLKNYKISVGLTDERWLTTVTQQTVIFIVRDYANILLEELKK